MFSYFVEYQILNVFPRSLVMRVRAWTIKQARKKALKRLKSVSCNGRFMILSIQKGGVTRG